MQLYQKISQTLLGLLALSLFSYAAAENQLAGHPSPYLALHGNDPVHWKAWNSEVFVSSKKLNRLVFVSVGYYSCHWCHVMQQQSYQDDAVAEFLNQHFIAVKVDRELQPDLDQRLIDFVGKIRGTAGWPLNVFLTPDGYPVTGFTYLPRDAFSDVLQRLDKEWQKNQLSLSHAAKEFFLHELQEPAKEPITVDEPSGEQLIEAFVSQAMLAADIHRGGFGNSSKFPNIPQLGVLLDIVQQKNNRSVEITDFISLSLKMMASQNLHDHVNGGFFRYTTDADWQRPHYEKMLYDNAQLAALYLKAHRQWPDQEYDEIAFRTLDFIESRLKHPSGGYSSSLSAVDINNNEGGAYLWSQELLARYLTPEETGYVSKLWHLQGLASEFLSQPLVGIGAVGNPENNVRILNKLQTRGSAEMPVDHKRLASWNAMMLVALVQASEFDARFETRAQVLFLTMQKNFFRNAQLIRFADNANLSDAVMEDYAQVAYAFYAYGKKFSHAGALQLATELVENAYALFFDKGRWIQKAKSLIPVAKGNWIIPDSEFLSPMTLWMKIAATSPDLDTQIKNAAMQMPKRITRDLLDTPFYYGSFILLRQN